MYNPYRNLCKAFPQEVKFFPFQLQFKRMEFSYAIEMVFRDVLPNLAHGNDGLIFTCRTSPYTFGTDQKILKWKPSDENSVDFRLKLEFPTVRRADLDSDSDEDDDDDDADDEVIDYNAKPKFVLLAFHGEGPDGPSYQAFSDMHVDEKEWEWFKALGVPLDEEIVECRMEEGPEKRWRFMRFRKDKKDANHISTVKSVIESIRDAVNQDELVRAWREIRDEWKKRNPPAPAAAR